MCTSQSIGKEAQARQHVFIDDFYCILTALSRSTNVQAIYLVNFYICDIPYVIMMTVIKGFLLIFMFKAFISLLLGFAHFVHF